MKGWDVLSSESSISRQFLFSNYDTVRVSRNRFSNFLIKLQNKVLINYFNCVHVILLCKYLFNLPINLVRSDKKKLSVKLYKNNMNKEMLKIYQGHL